MSHMDFGNSLRQAREHSGVSLRQIADATKLSVATLQALEHNRISQLPGGIYRRAIVRSFAGQVGLDPEATLRAFLTQYPDDVPSWATLLPAPSRLGMRGVLQAAGSALIALTR